MTIWRIGYETADAWQDWQYPSAGGVVQTDRIQQVPDPGGKAGPVLRFELRPGDVYDSGFPTSRVEVWGRAATPMSSPPAQWPDPVGAVRWYGFNLFVPTDFTATTDTKWLVFTQWKGLRGGSPPIGLEIKRSGLRLGGARTNSGLIPNDGALGAFVKGAWTRLEVGLSFSPDPKLGWVEVWRDGTQALTRTAVATMDLINGAPDPIYLKQGIYRDTAWTVPHVLYLGPVRVGDSRGDVAAL